MGLLTMKRPGPESPEQEHQWFHRFLNLQLAHDGVMIDDAQKTLAQQRAMAASHAKATTLDKGAFPPSEDDSMVHIGDQVTNQFPGTKFGALAKAGLIALAIGSGVGIPAAVMMLAKSPAASVVPSFVDTNSKFDFDLVNPDPAEAAPAPAPVP